MITFPALAALCKRDPKKKTGMNPGQGQVWRHKLASYVAQHGQKYAALQSECPRTIEHLMRNFTIIFHTQPT